MRISVIAKRLKKLLAVIDGDISDGASYDCSPEVRAKIKSLLKDLES